MDRYEAGMVLTGTEVKAAKDGKVQLKDSYATVIGNEAWLVNAHISQYSHGNIAKIIRRCTTASCCCTAGKSTSCWDHARKGTLADPDQAVPESGQDQVEFAVARGKKLHDKRETERARDGRSRSARGDAEEMNNTCKFAVENTAHRGH